MVMKTDEKATFDLIVKNKRTPWKLGKVYRVCDM